MQECVSKTTNQEFEEDSLYPKDKDLFQTSQLTSKVLPVKTR